MKIPNFWLTKSFNVLTLIMLPCSWLYRLLFIIVKNFSSPQKVTAKVICVGNITCGGSGKTPLVQAIARKIQQKNKKVAIVSRGYKGKLTGPIQVNLQKHNAQDVGDEPLLLAQTTNVFIAKNKYQAAKMACDHGAEYIILDDGLQNYTIDKNKIFCVIDSFYQFGNELLIPAGPLRQPIKDLLNKNVNFVIIGDENYKPAILNKELVHYAKVIPNKKDLQKLQEQELLAFSGIAYPDKFFNTLIQSGCNIKRTYAFADHHPYSRHELNKMINEAKQHNWQLVTTEKDYVKIPDDLIANVQKLSIELDINLPNITD